MADRRKNFFAHVRTSSKVDKEGRKVLMVEEVDSNHRYGDFRDEIEDTKYPVKDE